MSLQLSVIVPLYNEEECAERAMKDLVGALGSEGLAYEMILIDNGSWDKTGEILDTLAHQHPGIRVFHYPENLGYGGALIEGFKRARGDVLGFTCGDGEVSPQDVMKVYHALIKRNLEVCKAQRFDRQDGTWRKAMSLVYNGLVRLLFNTSARDVNGYPLMMRKNAYGKMRLTQTDWMINVDFLFNIRKAHLRLGEVQVYHRKRQGGTSHVNVFFPIVFFVQLLRFRFSMRETLLRGGESRADGFDPLEQVGQIR